MNNIDFESLFSEESDNETEIKLYAMMSEFKEKYPQVNMLDLKPMFHLLVQRMIEIAEECGINVKYRN